MSSATADAARSAAAKAPDAASNMFDGALAEISPLLAETDDNLLFGIVYWVELLILVVAVLVVTSLLDMGDGKVNLLQSPDKWDAGEYIVAAVIGVIGARVAVRKTGSDLFGLYPLTGYSEKQVKAFADE